MEQLELSLLTDHSILSSVGNKSSYRKGLTDMGMLSPGGGTRKYSTNRSTVIRLKVTRAGGGVQSAVALYHVFILQYASL